MKKIFRRFLNKLAKFFHLLFNIGIPLKAVLILCVLIGAGAVGLTYSKMMRAVGGKSDYNEAMRYIEIKDLLSENYIDASDRDSMADSAAAAMVSGLGDKWSYYMSADEFRAYQMSSANEYSGVGISIMKDENSGGFQITSVNTGSAAAKAGLASGMIIYVIDGQNVRSMDADEVRTLIRSRLNRKFDIEISSGEIFNVDCESTYHSTVNYRKEKTDAGYVQILDFEAGSGQDAINAIEELLTQNITALVIDIRGNAGGLESEIQTLLDYLLPGGTLFYVANRNGDIRTVSSEIQCIQLPMVVLINGQTYAEAEVFAACLQEYQWATLFGEATPGSTRKQQTIELSDGSAIRLSTETYLTPNRIDISTKGGVIPDMIVYNSDPSTVGTTLGTTGGEQGTASTSSDEALMSALTYLSKTA